MIGAPPKPFESYEALRKKAVNPGGSSPSSATGKICPVDQYGKKVGKEKPKGRKGKGGKGKKSTPKKGQEEAQKAQEEAQKAQEEAQKAQEEEGGNQ